MELIIGLVVAYLAIVACVLVIAGIADGVVELFGMLNWAVEIVLRITTGRPTSEQRWKQQEEERRARIAAAKKVEDERWAAQWRRTAEIAAAKKVTEAITDEREPISHEDDLREAERERRWREKERYRSY